MYANKPGDFEAEQNKLLQRMQNAEARIKKSTEYTSEEQALLNKYK